jgi:hypothetical protein
MLGHLVSNIGYGEPHSPPPFPSWWNRLVAFFLRRKS